MRLAYYVPASLLRHEGIRRRTVATAQTWRDLGHDVVEVQPQRPAPSAASAVDLARWERACDRDAFDTVRRLVEDGAVDHVHLRLFVLSGRWAGVAAQVPVSTEVHALLGTPESLRDLYRVVAAWRPARALVRRSAGAVFVTSEMADRFGFDGLPRTAIGNGVPLGETAAAPRNERPRLGFAVGSQGAWHGLDRLDALARRVPDADWVVIAPAHLAEWATGALGAGSPVRVVASTSRIHYDEVLTTLDATVGTMALDRRGLEEAAPLKVRDSVSAGIPVLLPYRDTNLDPADDPAVLRIDPRNADAAAHRVRSWLPGLTGRRLTQGTRDLVDLRSVEERRVQFLTGITPGRPETDL